VPTNKHRREAAQRHLQRQLERRAELTRKRRRTTGIVATVLSVLLVVGALLLLTGAFGDDASDTDAAAEPTAGSASAAPTSSAAAATTNADGTIACTYRPDDSGNPNLRDVGTPPNPKATPTQGTSRLVMSTNQGDLTLTLDRSIAPCAVESFTYLASQDFFDDTPCHRLTTTEGLKVLQCGDPTGTGMGGPSYRFAEEVTAETAYPRGTVAMAKSAAPSSTGSQFFLVYGDSQLPPEYTVVGTVDEAGLAVLDAIAEAGVEDGAQDGAPAQAVTIEELQAAA
jgi:cyclophilin family peptidyl-prolyl cis-trans isomerase